MCSTVSALAFAALLVVPVVAQACYKVMFPYILSPPPPVLASFGGADGTSKITASFHMPGPWLLSWNHHISQDDVIENINIEVYSKDDNRSVALVHSSDVIGHLYIPTGGNYYLYIRIVGSGNWKITASFLEKNYIQMMDPCPLYQIR